jgi:hypothetical protein
MPLKFLETSMTPSVRAAQSHYYSTRRKLPPAPERDRCDCVRLELSQIHITPRFSEEEIAPLKLRIAELEAQLKARNRNQPGASLENGDADRDPISSCLVQA